MGIYTNGDIFGIKIYNINLINNDIVVLYSKTYNIIMNEDEKKDAYLFYNELNDKENLYFETYMEYASTYEYNSDPFMMWKPISLNIFLDIFT